MELRNLYTDPSQQKTVTKLKAELARLKKQAKDDDQFANEQPPDGVDERQVLPKGITADESADK
jgi:hypothetical protein